MNILCEKSYLEQALLPVCKLASSRTTLPVLENILLEAKNKQLKMVATDLEIGIEKYINIQVVTDGATTVPAKVFADIISNLKNVPLEIFQENNNSQLEVRGEKFRYKFNVLPADEFPLLPEVAPMQSIIISSKVMREGIKDTVFAAASPGDVNTVIAGVLFCLENNILKMVATDGRRLAKKVITLSEDKGINNSFIVPVRALIELARLLSETDELIEIMIGESQVLFKLKDCSFFSRLIDGRFPQYENIIPRETLHKLQFEREELLAALKRAVVLAQDRETPKLIKLTAFNSKLVITAATQDLGQAYEEVSFDGDTKEEVTVAFNAKFLIDVLGIISDSKVKFEISQPSQPGVIKPSIDNGYIYVVMPVRTS